jgi:hypothetical protein
MVIIHSGDESSAGSESEIESVLSEARMGYPRFQGTSGLGLSRPTSNWGILKGWMLKTWSLELLWLELKWNKVQVEN